MKAERRHELQTNALADFVAHGLERTRPHWGTIAWAMAAGVAVIALFSVWSSRRGGSQDAAWQKYDDALRADPGVVAGRLKRVAEEFPNTAVALWARLDLADHLVFDGRDKLTKDREIGIAQFKEAQQAYAAVLASPHVLPDMVRRAAIAEAKCFELMGDREKAIEAYRAAAKKYAATLPGVAKDAERLAAELARPEAADFYKWLAEYEPPTSPGAASDLAFPPTMPGGSSEPSSEKPTLGDSPDSSESKSENDVPDSEKKTSSDPATKPADTSEKPTQPPATNKDSDPSSSDRKEPTPANPGDAPAKPDGANKPPVPTEPKD